jgi:hypothetical protein
MGNPSIGNWPLHLNTRSFPEVKTSIAIQNYLHRDQSGYDFQFEIVKKGGYT